MSILTANTLFHFTKGKDALLSILGTGFRPSYCDEFGEALSNVLNPIKIPMLWFCDLPMSKLEKHMHGYEWTHNGKKQNSSGYGNYGLGMTKEWGISKRLNPVTYVNPESYLLESAGVTSSELTQMYLEFNKEWNEALSKGAVSASGSFTLGVSDPASLPYLGMPLPFKRYEQSLKALSNALNIFSYMKPYKDSITGQLYYDEREWRYTIPYVRQYGNDVPVLNKMSTGNYIPLFGDPKQTYDINDYKKTIEAKYMVQFEAKDIKYIIVKNDNDVSDIMDRLDELEATGSFTKLDVDRLCTRIMTSEQIREDL